MSINKLFDRTLEYYNENAAKFAESTLGIDVSHLYSEFLPMLPPRGRILDAGCGSGRDAAYFKGLGYSVTAFDISPALAAIAGQVLGEVVRVMDFAQIDYESEFDGIWACSSLLHIPSAKMNGILSRITSALKPSGVLYLSFKYGTAETLRNGRFFNDYDEKKLNDLLEKHQDLFLSKQWITNDSRPDRASEIWINAILQKSHVL